METLVFGERRFTPWSSLAWSALIIFCGWIFYAVDSTTATFVGKVSAGAMLIGVGTLCLVLFKVLKKPDALVIAADSVAFGRDKIYWKDIQTLEVRNVKLDMLYYPILITTDRGLKQCNILKYQIAPERAGQLIDELISRWGANRNGL